MNEAPFSLTIAIYAHAPFVPAPLRRFGEEHPIPDAWFAFLSESLVPLLNTLQRLSDETIEAPISIGVSPLLCEMLTDLHLPIAYEKFLHRHIEWCRAHGREFASRGQDTLRGLALFWENWYQSAERDFEENWNRDLLDGLRRLQDTGAIELFTSPTTGAYLPFLSSESALAAQLNLAAENHKKHFARRPRGLWLPSHWQRPNDGPTTRLARLISEAGYEYAIGGAPSLRDDNATRFHAATSPLLRALLGLDVDEVPFHTSAHSPSVELRGDIVVLQPHGALCEQVWNRAGYAGDERFLEAERRAEPGHLRLWRVTGAQLPISQREPYDALGNATVCEAQATHWLERAATWAPHSGARVCAAFEAGLFGARWFEGPNWLYRVLKKAAQSEHIQLQFAAQSATLDSVQTLENAPLLETSVGTAEASLWLNAQTGWLWPAIAECEKEMESLARDFQGTSNPKLCDILNQAAREVLLLQSGDWAIALSTGGGLNRISSHEAANRVADHIDAFRGLAFIARTIAGGQFMSEGERAYFDAQCERNDIFPELSFEHWLRA